MKCAAQQVLRNWLEIFSTYLEIYTLDVEIIMKAELTELNPFCIKRKAIDWTQIISDIDDEAWDNWENYDFRWGNSFLE